ncbi:MAG: UvrD-helicase domain-containing protein [Acidimicrobiales bacterium]
MSQLDLFSQFEPEPQPPDLDNIESSEADTTQRVPADQAARDQIAHRLDSTMFVEAGAGSGKTSALVQRVIQLVASGVEMRHIAAITFTEKAALELRDRVRRKLEETADETTDALLAERCSAALDQVDGAAISTLHAFAQRVLSEHPVEAGLPPSIEVLDEISSQVAFDERWRSFLDELLDDDDQAELLLLADTLGIRLDVHLRDVAIAFRDNWDLVAEADQSTGPLSRPRIQPILDRIAQIDDLTDQCKSADDKLLTWIPNLVRWGQVLESTDDVLDLVEVLRSPPGGRLNGTAKNWRCDVDDVRALIRSAQQMAADEVARLTDSTIRRLASVVAGFTLEHVEDRRTNGRLEFHDLLVLARQMLRNPQTGWQTRQALRGRYRRLLLDEFQDTDPIQIDLAVLIASADPDAGTKPWNQIPTEAGRLFFVGDPKQSIYRFRRADVSLFLEARNTFSDSPVSLDTNFRTVSPVIEWVNTVFSELIRGEADRQPEYQSLLAWRPPLSEKTNHVTVLGATEHGELSADELRRAEAQDVAAVIGQALDQGWQVHDEDSGTWRPCRPNDITVLLPARTSLPALERALESAQIDYRAESSSLVWSTAEIRELMAVLRAVDDPTDELSLATALRSAAYGCGDDDLFRWRRVHGGTWNHQADPPPGIAADDPVAQAMLHLGELHRARMWTTPSALIERIIRERRLLELGVARSRPRDVWRRLRFVQDQARAYVDSEGGGLRQFISWATLQSAEGSRVAETLLPETDADAVRIMTIHASKGLEFPITVLSGLTTAGSARRAGVQVAFPRGGDVVIKMSKDLATADYDEFKPIDEQMDHLERLRLLYVGATRARDHLVVSLHRSARQRNKNNAERPANLLSGAQLIEAAASRGNANHAVFAPSPTPQRSAGQPSPDTADTIDRPSWETARSAALARGAVSSTLAATTIAKYATPRTDQATESVVDPGMQKGPRDIDLPPWNKGRYGTAIGRAVHAVLQTIDLDGGAGVEQTVAAQAAAEAVIGYEALIADLVHSALDSPVVREAVTLPHWRETYVAAPVDSSTTIEGYIDLLYRRGDGLVIVDYKTDSVDQAELSRRMGKYELQGATYAIALERATGETVADVVFLFLSPDGAKAVSVNDLAGAKAAVAELASVSRHTVG